MSSVAWMSGSPQGVFGCRQPFGVAMKWLAALGAPRTESSICACALDTSSDAATANETDRLVIASAEVRREEVDEAEHHGDLTQHRNVQLTNDAARARVNCGPERAALRRHFGAKRRRERRHLGAQIAAKHLDVVSQHENVVLRRERVFRARDLELDG